MPQSGNVHYYSEDPFYGLFEYKKVTEPEPFGPKNCGDVLQKGGFDGVHVCPDYISNTDKSFSLMRKGYYEDKLADSSQFEGFVPRTYVPATNLSSKVNPDVKVT